MDETLNKSTAPNGILDTSNTFNQYQGTVKIVIPNKYVACKPYQQVENKSSVFSSWELKNPLVELEVVYADKEGEYIAGSNVYVRPFLDPPTWIKDIFTFNGKEVILVPKDQIVGYKFLEEQKLTFPNPWPFGSGGVQSPINPLAPYPYQPWPSDNTSYTFWISSTGSAKLSDALQEQQKYGYQYYPNPQDLLKK